MGLRCVVVEYLVGVGVDCGSRGKSEDHEDQGVKSMNKGKKEF